MLVKFTVENWKSFKEKTEFSMVSTREKQHGQRIPKVARYRIRILPACAIFGGNASGKTNFIDALSFVQKFVKYGTRIGSLISVKPFLLGEESEQKDICSFDLVMMIKEKLYDYSFSVSRTSVIEEQLIEMTGKKEKLLYHRKNGEMFFETELSENSPLRIVYEGTQDNQLFLSNAYFQKRREYADVYEWISDNMTIVAPDTRFEEFSEYILDFEKFEAELNRVLNDLDTGIVRFALKDIPIEKLNLAQGALERLESIVKEGHLLVQMRNWTEVTFFKRMGGELHALKMATYHLNSSGHEVEFELQQESDGSQRAISLLPVFLQLAQSEKKKVFVIDELDRSLHSVLTRSLIKYYFSTCSPESRSQMIFTTHDLMLMDQELLRRDEMWVTERDATGGSHLRALCEYEDTRYDKNLLKSYLDSAFGGVPKVKICTLKNHH